MERAELDQLLLDLIEERLPARRAEQLLQRITSEPEVARAYAEVKLRADMAAEKKSSEMLAEPLEFALARRQYSFAGFAELPG